MLKKIKCCIVELFYFSLKGHRQQLELSLRHLTKILHQPFAYFSMKFIKKKKTKNFLLLRQTLFLGLLLIDPRPVLENYPEQGQASFHTVVSQISQDATSSLFQVGNFPHLKSPFLVITLISPSLLLSWNIVSNLSEINLPCPA